VFDVAVAGTLLTVCGLAKPQAAIELNSRYTDIKNAVIPTAARHEACACWYAAGLPLEPSIHSPTLEKLPAQLLVRNARIRRIEMLD
jgi:hypothetical protein